MKNSTTTTFSCFGIGLVPAKWWKHPFTWLRRRAGFGEIIHVGETKYRVVSVDSWQCITVKGVK